MTEIHLAIFRGQQIRRTIHNNEWWFSVIDVVSALTDSSIPRRYWSDLKIKIEQEGYSELYEKIVQLKIRSSDGKMYLTDCADTETLFRIIQSIPSPKAEPFKRWLARVGYGEASTTRITRAKDARGFPKNKKAARDGGTIAGDARRALEVKSGQKVSTPRNYLASTEHQKLPER